MENSTFLLSQRTKSFIQHPPFTQSHKLNFSYFFTNIHSNDQLIQYYFTHRKTACSYRTMKVHFVDIATTNAFTSHHEICSANQVQSIAHKDSIVFVSFVGWTRQVFPTAGVTDTDAAQKATKADSNVSAVSRRTTGGVTHPESVKPVVCPCVLW